MFPFAIPMFANLRHVRERDTANNNLHRKAAFHFEERILLELKLRLNQIIITVARAIVNST